MVEYETANKAKPSRSDEVLGPDRRLQIYNHVRAHFDSLAPNRPTKPSRSESDSHSQASSPLSYHTIPVPELNKFHSLQSQSQTIFADGSGTSPVVQDEFVETQYYTELGSIDRQHYATGSGFIKVIQEKNGDEDGYNIHDQLQTGHGNNGGYRESVFKTNPATNDWIPSLEDHQVQYVSSKPSRSESN